MTAPSPELQTILFLASNPDGLRQVSRELRDIKDGLRRSQNRNQFTLNPCLDVRTRDIQRALLDAPPQIIHFAGNGTGEEGLIFEDESGNPKLVDGAALAGLFALFADDIRCVVLNGCYSDGQAKVIAQHIPHVIGMNKAIGDKAAISFAVGFYDALGAGRDVEFAFNLGCATIRMEGIAEHLTPVLIKKPTEPASHGSDPPTTPTPPNPSIAEHLTPVLIKKPTEPASRGSDPPTTPTPPNLRTILELIENAFSAVQNWLLTGPPTPLPALFIKSLLVGFEGGLLAIAIWADRNRNLQEVIDQQFPLIVTGFIFALIIHYVFWKNIQSTQFRIWGNRRFTRLQFRFGMFILLLVLGFLICLATKSNFFLMINDNWSVFLQTILTCSWISLAIFVYIILIQLFNPIDHS